MTAKLYLLSEVTGIVCLKDKQIVQEFVLIFRYSCNECLSMLGSEFLISNIQGQVCITFFLASFALLGLVSSINWPR